MVSHGDEYKKYLAERRIDSKGFKERDRSSNDAQNNFHHNEEDQSDNAQIMAQQNSQNEGVSEKFMMENRRPHIEDF